MNMENTIKSIGNKNVEMFKACKHLLSENTEFIILTMDLDHDRWRNDHTIFLFEYDKNSKLLGKRHIIGEYSQGVRGPSKNPKLKEILFTNTSKIVLLSTSEFNALGHLPKLNRLCHT